jgi:hypothetical protein
MAVPVRFRVWTAVLIATLAFLGGCGKRQLHVALDLLDALPEATVISRHPNMVRVVNAEVGEEQRQAIFVPPRTELRYTALIPQKARLEFGCATPPGRWKERGDGVLFEILVATTADREVIVHSRYIDPKTNPEARRWFDERVNLTSFEGQRVTISLSTKPGPADDSFFDEALWSHPRLLGLPS